ncbi:hypothetical protein ABZV29_18445 [Streptomyces sp. NPDC005236]|uniref:hypothetical protein n=1 Tax=Streptomyces sp. NPDC005236 TaxID=3157028 RepID=UPI0033B09495
MDSGTAAVLGAAVGAVGTGAAGVVTALFARSQARFQITAEHARISREPRKATYVAYAEISQRIYDKIHMAENELGLIESSQQPEEQQYYIDAARVLYAEAEELEPEWEHLQAKVYIEGPDEVISAAVDYSSELINFMHTVLGSILEREGEWRTLLSDMRRKAYREYLKFLRVASAAANADGLK